jgi:predicted chitinase
MSRQPLWDYGEGQDYSCTIRPQVTRLGSPPQKTKAPEPQNLCPFPQPKPLWNLMPMCGPMMYIFDFTTPKVAPQLPPLVSPEELRKIVPTLSAQRAIEVSGPLSLAMIEAEVTTPLRKAAFLAQLAHESGGFRYAREFGNESYFTKLYEGRKDLGNTETGDGVRFKGRGFIQLTGRANYTAAGKDLGLDLVNDPEMVERDLSVAARVTAWYWKKRNLNRYADSDNFVGLTKAINGGTNGLPDRQAYYERAKAVFGVKNTKGK